MPVIYGPDGQPIDLTRLRKVEAEAKVVGVRQVTPQHPSWGLGPEGLAAILRDSEGVDPSRYYALCEDVAEREWHYRGVLGQRRSALAQLPITVDPASDDAEHVRHADLIRDIVSRPEFTFVRFDLSDALDKGMAFGELIWETSEKKWMPKGIELRNAQWFRFSQADLKTPLLIDDHGQPQPLTPYKWIVHRARLTSGIPIRDGLGRAACWAWMFKNFDIKSWMIFLDKYGQPIRLGRYPVGTSYEDRRKFLRALRDLGSDAAAMVAEGFNVEFIKVDGVGNGAAFKDQATYFDEQISKLVVGQTGTTDASKGGYAVGKVHEGVRQDICLYDGIVLATTFNRDLVRPCIDLNFGPPADGKYPTVRIGIAEQKDAELILKNIGEFVDRGLEVEASQIYPLLGLTEPAKGGNVVLLRPTSRPQPGAQPGGPPAPSGEDDRAGRRPAGAGVLSTLAVERARPDSIDALSEDMARGMEMWADIQRQIEAAIDESTSFEELSARIESLASGPAGQELVAKLALAMFNARLAGELGAPIADQA